MVFLYTLLFIFAIVGFTEIVSYLIFRIMSIKNECSTMLITPINSNSNYEFIIRSAIEKAKWMGSFRPQKIIIVTENLSKEEINDIKSLTYGYDFIKIIDKKYLSNEVNSL